MVMILQFYTMNGINLFFKILYSNPSLLWKAGAAFIFLTMALVIALVPSLGYGLDESTRWSFIALLALYGAFRFFTFYNEYKKVKNEEG